MDPSQAPALILVQSLVEEASKPLVGSPPVYKSSDVRIPQMYTLIQPPSLLVFKSGELTAKLHLGDIPTKPEKLTQWMLEKRLPLALELSPDNFQDVMKSPARPLVVLAVYNPAAPDAGRVEEGVKAFADTWRVEHPRAAREVVHVWMDGVKWKEWLKSMYGLSGTLPKVVIVDHAVRCWIPCPLQSGHADADAVADVLRHGREGRGDRVRRIQCTACVGGRSEWRLQRETL